MRHKKANARKDKEKRRDGDKRDEIEHAVQPAAAQAPSVEGYLTVTEDSMKEALIEARGDIFVAAQLLRITAIRLDRAVSASTTLQAVVDSIQEQGKGVPLEKIHAAVEKRLSMYRVAGLDALHDLATMPIDENSAQNQVKLAAAARLAGTVEGGGGSGEFEQTLRELNSQYQKEAPRLRVTRERLTIETLPPERVVGPEAEGA